MKTNDAYLTFSQWVYKYYRKKIEDLTEDEYDQYWDEYDSTVNEWTGISELI